MKLIQCRFSSGLRVPLLVQAGNNAVACATFLRDLLR